MSDPTDRSTLVRLTPTPDPLDERARAVAEAIGELAALPLADLDRVRAYARGLARPPAPRALAPVVVLDAATRRAVV